MLLNICQQKMLKYKLLVYFSALLCLISFFRIRIPKTNSDPESHYIRIRIQNTDVSFENVVCLGQADSRTTPPPSVKF